MKNVKTVRPTATSLMGKKVFAMINNEATLTKEDKDYLISLYISEKQSSNQQALIDNLIKNDTKYKSTITRRATFLRDNGLDKELSKLKAQVKTGMDKLNKNYSLQGLGTGKDKDGNFKQKPTIGIKQASKGGKTPKTQADKVNQELKKDTKVSCTREQAWDFAEEHFSLDDIAALKVMIMNRVKAA